MEKQYPDLNQLNKLAVQLRKDILTMLEKAASGHPGGSLSIVEILIGLYYHALKHDPKNPKLSTRDIFILSKGHGCPALYAVLVSCGYFPYEELFTLRSFGSRLQGHAFFHVPGVEASTGSLGQGLSIANGFALAAKMDSTERKVFCLLGDGEIQEGQVWEAAMSAGHYCLDNLIAIIDRNTLQIDGFVHETMDVEPLGDKFRAFGWEVLETDGHNLEEIMKTYDKARNITDKPVAIIAHTVKGKGVSFMEHEVKWHGVAPKKHELDDALKELDN